MKGKVASIGVFIVILVVFNVLSHVFDWGVILY